MLYSVSPRRKLRIVGLKPSWNFSTRMPTRLAARKCPSSCTKTRTPSTKANARIVCMVANQQTSDFQFYPACNIERTFAGPPVHAPHGRERLHLDRPMRVHGSRDHQRDGREADAAVEEPRHRHFVGGIEDDGQAAPGLQCAIGKP